MRKLGAKESTKLGHKLPRRVWVHFHARHMGMAETEAIAFPQDLSSLSSPVFPFHQSLWLSCVFWNHNQNVFEVSLLVSLMTIRSLLYLKPHLWHITVSVAMGGMGATSVLLTSLRGEWPSTNNRLCHSAGGGYVLDAVTSLRFFLSVFSEDKHMIIIQKLISYKHLTPHSRNGHLFLRHSKSKCLSSRWYGESIG